MDTSELKCYVHNSMRAQIRHDKEILANDMQALAKRLTFMAQELLRSKDNATRCPANSFGEIQSIGALINSRCGALWKITQLYGDLSKLLPEEDDQ